MINPKKVSYIRIFWIPFYLKTFELFFKRNAKKSLSFDHPFWRYSQFEIWKKLIKNIDREF